MKRIFVVLAIFAALLNAGPVRADETFVSPYYRPAGTDLFYKYGNFCGPGIPAAEGVPSAENIARVIEGTPVDYIDFACKVHDLCYLRFGVRQECDTVLSRLLGNQGFGGSWENEAQCQSLANEISIAVLLRSGAHRDNLGANVAGAVGSPVVAGAYLGLRGLSGLARRLMNSGGSAWPTEPGQCRVLETNFRSVGIFMASARLHHELGDSARDPALWNSYRDSFDIFRFTAGYW